MSSQSTSSKDLDYLAGKSRIRIQDLQEAKKRGQKWAMLTSYDTVSAKIFDMAKIPCLLIGDSAAQTVLGHKSTLSITVNEMIVFAKAVAASCERALVVVDLPFGSYEASPEKALESATRIMKESGAHAVKMEGDLHFADHVKLLVRAGVPVMAHVGFTPQSEHTLSGFKVQGRSDDGDRVIRDALAMQEAGAFACVLEMVSSSTAKKITEKLVIPTIGIGAGPYCDAQILVWHDMAGFTKPKGSQGGYMCGDEAKSSSDSNDKEVLELGRVPKFVKRYGDLTNMLYGAVKEFANDVSNGTYPAPEHSYD